MPKWVSPALHTGNLAALYLDMYACAKQRTFSRRAEALSLVHLATYLAYLGGTSWQNGDYVYKFMCAGPGPSSVIPYCFSIGGASPSMPAVLAGLYSEAVTAAGQGLWHAGAQVCMHTCAS